MESHVLICYISKSGQHELNNAQLIGKPRVNNYPRSRLLAICWYWMCLHCELWRLLLYFLTITEVIIRHFFCFFMAGYKRAEEVKNRSKLITGNFCRHFTNDMRDKMSLMQIRIICQYSYWNFQKAEENINGDTYIEIALLYEIANLLILLSWESLYKSLDKLHNQ